MEKSKEEIVKPNQLNSIVIGTKTILKQKNNTKNETLSVILKVMKEMEYLNEKFKRKFFKFKLKIKKTKTEIKLKKKI